MTAALQLTGVTKTYRSGVSALKGINLTVAPGDFFALLGPNGAGKSTSIGIVSSLVKKTSGTVSIFGHDLDSDLEAAKRQIGVVPQEFNFGQFEKVIDILATQAGYYGIARPRAYEQAEKYLHQLGLWEKRDQQARMLSGGMKRRLMVARALVHEPRLLILDEPTAGVDIELRRSMWDYLTTLNQQGTTIILTTHYLEEAESLCRNIAILDKGEVVENTDMRSLLAKLQQETFVLDISHELNVVPELDDYQIRQPVAGALEVTIRRGQTLNAVFAALSAQGIDVTSLRNKTNRLEELFVSLVEKNLADGGAA
ncbi:ABC transporter ATP-binding protein [Perlucidibaca piscinae]|uniref:ABC transporter ATP-binding protein n=1 Tax=Perlucidibaca piscinae TaxID=392589 RepID=UPI0003B48FD2|nr:ABC transporter ATP-binding protein [Perlucidibaca piscinae]